MPFSPRMCCFLLLRQFLDFHRRLPPTRKIRSLLSSVLCQWAEMNSKPVRAVGPGESERTQEERYAACGLLLDCSYVKQVEIDRRKRRASLFFCWVSFWSRVWPCAVCLCGHRVKLPDHNCLIKTYNLIIILFFEESNYPIDKLNNWIKIPKVLANNALVNNHHKQKDLSVSFLCTLFNIWVRNVSRLVFVDSIAYKGSRLFPLLLSIYFSYLWFCLVELYFLVRAN